MERRNNIICPSDEIIWWWVKPPPEIGVIGDPPKIKKDPPEIKRILQCPCPPPLYHQQLPYIMHNPHQPLVYSPLVYSPPMLYPTPLYPRVYPILTQEVIPMGRTYHRTSLPMEHARNTSHSNFRSPHWRGYSSRRLRRQSKLLK